MSQAISSGDIQAVNYFVSQRYIEALEKLASASNQKVLMMPVEASAVLGSLGGITELARAAFGGSVGEKGQSQGQGPWSR